MPLPPPNHVPAPSKPPPSTGAFQTRVRYCECDPMGVAHHASYIPWLEIGRTELLRQTGVSYAHLEAAGVFLVITRLEVRYRRPIFYDDVVEVRTRVTGGSRVKIEHAYELVLVEDGGHGKKQTVHPSDIPPSPVRPIGESLAIASTQLACVGSDGRIQPLPDWLVASTA
ncbi:MAG: acyl-CoA thioesterase [Phycisphaerales bacterium]